jgi:phytoene dehydrogenase-like protein
MNVQSPVVIVGAGLAGLTCARHLQRQRIPVLVLEADDDVGGRVRTDYQDGFVLDRGFQVLFDAYPAVRRNIDLQALDLQTFDPGAIIYRDGRHSVLTDPARDRRWSDILAAVTTPAMPAIDKLRTLRLALAHFGGAQDQLSEPDEQSTLDYLRAQGFSGLAIDTFYRPFFAGIFLLRDLSTTAAAFRFYMRMLASGRTVLPAGGMGMISRQLAAPLQEAGVIRCRTRVTELLRDGQRITGARLHDGEEIAASGVVLATDAQTASQLAGINTPGGALHATAIYFAGSARLYQSRKIVLNAAPDAFVNNAQLLSNIAPSYAPPGRHLLSAVVLGMPTMDERELVVAAMRDLRRMFAPDPEAARALRTYYPLRTYRIRYAQFPQPAGIYRTLPPNRLKQRGLYAAAEWTEGSSINGAMLSGERCAAVVTDDLRLMASPSSTP